MHTSRSPATSAGSGRPYFTAIGKLYRDGHHCENLAKLAKRKSYLQMLAKLRIEKPCETRICETLLILRNKYKTAKEIFEKPCQTRT